MVRTPPSEPTIRAKLAFLLSLMRCTVETTVRQVTLAQTNPNRSASVCGNQHPKPFSSPSSRAPRQFDARTRRTRDTLGDALVELMQQKPFHAITVQDVLDRAGVGCTTFYTHYRDKQDLFLSDVEDFFEGLSTVLTRRNAPADRIAPVQEFFAHVAEVREFCQALLASGKAPEIRELGVGMLARSIESRLAMAGDALLPDELRATSQALAGALFSPLEWWVNNSRSASPAEMDALFHRLAWRGIAPSLPGDVVERTGQWHVATRTI